MQQSPPAAAAENAADGVADVLLSSSVRPSPEPVGTFQAGGWSLRTDCHACVSSQ